MLRHYIELPLAVRILCLGALINRAGSFVLVFLTIYASEQLGFGVLFATTCMGVFGLGSMTGAMLGGQLADQIGRRTVMLTALFGGAAMLLVLGNVGNRWAFMGSVFVFAVLSDMYRPAAAAMVADLVQIDRRHHAFALMYISINLGFAIAPPVGGLLAEYSYQWLFWGDALTTALFGIIVLVRIPETLPRKIAPLDVGSATLTHTPKAMAHIARDVTFLVFCLSTLLMALVFMQGFSTLPIYLRQSGLSNVQYGLLMSINGALIFILQLPMTQWLGRFNAMSVVIAGGILIAIGYGLNAVGTGLLFFAMTIAIWTIGEILQAPFTQSIVTTLAPVELRARYLGVFNMCFATALTIGAPLGGTVLNHYGATILWSGAFVVALTAVALYLLIHPAITARHIEAAMNIEPGPATETVMAGNAPEKTS